MQAWHRLMETGMKHCASGCSTCPKHPTYLETAQMRPLDDEEMAQNLVQS